MFRSFVTRLNLSRLKGKVKRAVPKTNNASKDKRVLLKPTHLRLGSAFCFPDTPHKKTLGSTESQKCEYSTVVDRSLSGI